MPKTVNVNEKFFTPAEIAEKLGVHNVTIWRKIRSGELKAIAISKRDYRIAESDFAEYLTKRKGV